jgi:hypothetical protein
MKMKTNKETNEKNKMLTPQSQAGVTQLGRDLRDSILVVSVLINAYVFIAWLVLQVTTRFDTALISYLQHR